MAAIQKLVTSYTDLLTFGALVAIAIVVFANAWNFHLRFKLWKFDRRVARRGAPSSSSA
jgi:uncharacterized membrane protein